MLIIREKQDRVLAKHAENSFEVRMLQHLRRIWREECEAMGEAILRQTIREGVKRAGRYGIITEYDAARFIDLMFTICWDFDDHDEVPWAKEILTSRRTAPNRKMDALYERFEKELKDLDQSEK